MKSIIAGLGNPRLHFVMVALGLFGCSPQSGIGRFTNPYTRTPQPPDFVNHQDREVAAQQPGPMTPEYCVNFSVSACARIQEAVETNTVPIYCKPGFALANNGLNLSQEQIRICYVTTDVAYKASPGGQKEAAERKILEAQMRAKNLQKIEDARAAVRESWGQYSTIIKAIEIGYKCDVLDDLLANVAVRKIQMAMNQEQIDAGLIGDSDPTMSIEKFTTVNVQAGKEAAENGACDRMTPAMRGHLRSMVSSLQ